MNTLATRLGLLGLFLLAGGALVLGEQIDLVYFEENGGGGNPRGLYNFDASTGNSTLLSPSSSTRKGVMLITLKHCVGHNVDGQSQNATIYWQRKWPLGDTLTGLQSIY